MSGRRDPAVAEAHRARLAELYLRHRMPLYRIAEELGVNPKTVQADLRVLEQRWVESAAVDFSAARAAELARIDQLETVAWEAWERSCGEKTATTTKRVTEAVMIDGKVVAGAQREKGESQIRREQMLGNPAFLERVAWCIDRRCKLLGLDEPEKIDIAVRDRRQSPVVGDPAIVTDAQDLILRFSQASQPPPIAAGKGGYEA